MLLLFQQETHLVYLQHLLFNDVLVDVNDKLRGFTLGVASTNTNRVDWLSKYMVSGAPLTSGSTYWWRVTVKPGNTLTVQ
jgi:hypothetical protein